MTNPFFPPIRRHHQKQQGYNERSHAVTSIVAGNAE